MWFQITFNRDGSVSSCTQVQQSFPDGKRVVYVEADSSEDALKLANRLYMRSLRQRYEARGLCSCGGTPLPGKKRCVTCKKRDDKSNAKRAGREPPAVDYPEAQRPFRETLVGEARREARRSVLLEVLAASERMRSIEQLRAWLREQAEHKEVA